MPRFIVNYSDSNPRTRYTPGQFLAEFAEVDGGRSKVRDLPHPVIVSWANEATEFYHKTCRTAGELFALFQRIGAGRWVIIGLRWEGCWIGPCGLYALTRAVREPAVRKGGLNIVRHWLENRRGCMTPLGCDLSALFDFLEIRPLFQREKAKNAPSLSAQNHAPQSDNAIRYVYNTIF